jgi:hypothetical protein
MLTYVVEQGQYDLSKDVFLNKKNRLYSDETYNEVAYGGKNFVPGTKNRRYFANPVVYHITIYKNENPVAYLSRDTYQEAMEAGSRYVSK